ncbi:unnamed protein product [Phytophthora fragariaefolia]|uniref:Unnamed protein product n=1 Tax=Phytophthora fragariaefolia TaxID=1490495 RepID=A0A9W7D304_9STRA|nr:unnamed protein product [Phytophthora fragariaefolia]
MVVKQSNINKKEKQIKLVPKRAILVYSDLCLTGVVYYQASMGRAKRKWTREEIEEALRQNARVNATPAVLEEITEKRKRQRRRANKKRNLLKELEALSVVGTEAVVPATNTVHVQSVPQDPTTLEQEGKQEEDDPTEHQRLFAAAYAAGLGQAAPETEAQVTHPSSAGRATAKRARNAEQQRVRRANMTASQTERRRAKNRERQRARRAQMTEEQRGAIRHTEGLRQQLRRAQQTPLASDAERERNREQRQILRHTQTHAAQNVSRESDRDRHAASRADRSTTELNVEREQNRVRRKAPKRCLGHVNHEDFRASMATGKDVVDGRHRLPPTTVCPLCQAWKWPAESDFICCLKDRVQLPPLQPAPPRLLQLYGDKEFRRHIRTYNQAFAFTSIGASSSDNTFRDVNQDQSVAGQHGVYTYRIQGAMGNFMGSMLPYVDRRTGERVPPKFVQIYIVDPDMQERANRRKGIFADLDIVALQDIENMMVECNPFAQQFLSFDQKLREDLARGMQVKDIRYVLHSKPSEPRTYNLPTVSEVGVAMVEDGNLTRPRDLYVVAKDHSLLRLFETDEKYDPLQYPLLFPHGDLGWTYTDVYANGAKYRNKRRMSLREHVAYRLFQKVHDQAALHQGGRLFQQWVVDQRAKCEQEQLRWVAKNQKKLRAELYHGISDALRNEETITLDEGEVLVSEYDRSTGTLVHPDRGSKYEDFLNQVGKRIVLPDSHSRSPRNMYKHYQESMAIVREYGKPDAFITMTCNPKWVEIIVLLPDEQTAQDRPDIVARVWQLKLKAKLADLDEGLLGRLEARIYVVEFQKRGLPHAHIVIIVAEEDKPRTREIIDKLVSAERTLTARV